MNKSNIILNFGDKSCTLAEWENLVLNGTPPEGWTYQDIEELDDTIAEALNELYSEPTIYEGEE